MNVLQRDVADSDIRQLLDFIEEQWNSRRAFDPSDEWLDAYDEAYKSRPPGPAIPPPDGASEATLDDLTSDWGDYVSLIDRQERCALANGWEIHVYDFPEEGSFLEEAEACTAAFLREPSFAQMTERDRRLVAGFGEDTSGYFGRNVGAGYFKQRVIDEPETIGHWLDAVPLSDDVTDAQVRRFFEGTLGDGGAGERVQRDINGPGTSSGVLSKHPVAPVTSSTSTASTWARTRPR